MMDWKGLGRTQLWPNRVDIHEYNGWTEKNHENRVRRAGVLAEI
jgi:hypothetical protein